MLAGMPPATPYEEATMQEQRNKEAVRRFVDEYQTHADERAFDELIHPDLVDHSRPPGIAEGPEGVRQQFDGFRAAFGGFRAEILDQVAEGDKVVTYKVFRGVHSGEFAGIPPTGREVEIAVIDIVRLVDGRIAEHWNVVDRLGLLAQLGALPAAAAA
jgi:predicted ester cyclase